jgi:transcriptional regulator with XRE-family HTH domain
VKKYPNRLQELRKEYGLKQDEYAEQSGVAKQTVEKLEQGVNNINNASVDTIIKLSEALRLTVEEFMSKVKLE